MPSGIPKNPATAKKKGAPKGNSIESYCAVLNKNQEASINRHNRIQEVIDRVVNGESIPVIRKDIEEKYGVSKTCSMSYVKAAVEAQKEEVQHLARNWAQIAYDRLEKMYADAVKDNDKKMQMEALKELNKLFGANINSQVNVITGEVTPQGPQLKIEIISKDNSD